jgi:VIT1/CCC1 family predicted Fe2+/Mn2+ transporter
MADGHKRVLDPSELTAEVLFGLIMVLTFTGSLSVAEAGPADVRAMLIGALGCNLAWGVIDGVLYLMGVLAEKSSSLNLLLRIRAAGDMATARALIAAAAPVLASGLGPEDVERLRLRLLDLPAPPPRMRLDAHDWRGAFGVFALVVLATFPVALPFLFIRDPGVALRASNGVAVVMLFVTGMAYGRAIQRSPWMIAGGMALLGITLVALTIALGG